MTASEERATARTERVPVERVRVAKRVVTRRHLVEVEVELRREELVVTREPVDAGEAGGAAADDPRDREVVLVLHEEVPVVSVEARPLERVRVGVRRVAGTTPVTVDLAREVVEVVEVGADEVGAREVGAEGVGPR